MEHAVFLKAHVFNLGLEIRKVQLKVRGLPHPALP